jgi:hypothetical protein
MDSRDQDKSRLLQLGRQFCLAGTNPITAFMCLDHVFSIAPQISGKSVPELAAMLLTLFDYARLLKDILRIFDSQKDLSFQRLLGIQVQYNNVFLIPTRTRLYGQLKGYKISPQSSSDDRTFISGQELSKLVTKSLRDRLPDTLLRSGPFTQAEKWPLSMVLLFLR